MDRVRNILIGLGLEKYCATFEENEVDFDAFLQLQDEDYKDMKIPIGPRRKIKTEINRIISGLEKGNKFALIAFYSLRSK